VAVHGERALVPGLTKAEAAKVLDHFTEVDNKAGRALDAELVTTIETGPLGVADRAGLRALRATSPGGNPDFQDLQLTDPQFLIPRQRGWPKWFVADAAANRGGARWLLVFQRGGVREAWKASYVAAVPPSSVPRFATDAEGYAEPVSANASDLLVRPADLSAAYTGYLQKGGGRGSGGQGGSAVFADGAATSGWLATRAKSARTADYVKQYADQPAAGGQFPPVALRTEDGGALVFFASHHQERTTYRAGLTPPVSATTRALMTGTAEHSVTLVQIGREAVTVPPKSAGGKVTFLDLILNLVAAKGS
jgi:hypothetical protein